MKYLIAILLVAMGTMAVAQKDSGWIVKLDSASGFTNYIRLAMRSRNGYGIWIDEKDNMQISSPCGYDIIPGALVKEFIRELKKKRKRGKVK